MRNATSKSNVEPNYNFDCFSRRLDKVVFNLELSNLVDSDVPSQSRSPLELSYVKIDD